MPSGRNKKENMFLFIFLFLGSKNLGDPKISQLVLIFFLVIFLNSSKPTFPLKRYLSGNIDDGYSV